MDGRMDWERSLPEVVDTAGNDKNYELYKLVDLHGGGK
jgi:hypothetical protein